MSEIDQISLRDLGKEGFIYNKVVSKKFRKWAVDKSSEERIRKAINISVSNNEPIRFVYPFGGYKLWRFPTAPQVDRAEFFTIAYYRDYVLPITSVYEPGIDFCFSSDDIIIERMDNVAGKDTDSYFDTFSKLLTLFKDYFPTNLKMEIKRIADLYPDRDKFEEELKANVSAQLSNWESMDPIRKEKMLKTSIHNINFGGVENWGSLSEEQRKEKIKMGVIYHDAYGKVPRRVSFVRGENKIVVFTTVISNAVALGTTKNSITKFWTGYGILEEIGDSFLDRVLSFDQMGRIINLPHETSQIDLIPLRNFQKIDVYKGELNFEGRAV